MADDTTHVSKKLDDMRRQATARLEEARSIVASMNTVETIFDLPLTILADLGTAALTTPPPEGVIKGSVEPWGSTPLKRRSPQSIRPDEYLGEEPMKAAKKYIASIGHAVHFDEIADAVQRGGAAIQGADWRDRLGLSLKRSPYDVITAAENTYGLADFYTPEQLNRLKESRRRGGDSNSTGKKKKRGRPKGRPKQAAKKKAGPKQQANDSTKGEAPARRKPGRPPKKAADTADGEQVASGHVH